MKIMTLGSSAKLLHPLLDFHEIFHEQEPLSLSTVEAFDPNLIVSFGFRHMISTQVVKQMRNKILNLHISFLPWNRGADPNFWSWFENTPKGVSIHLIDEGLDTGSILFQSLVNLEDSETLASSYEILQSEIVKLFECHLEQILKLEFNPIPQDINAGSQHKSVDKEEYFRSLPKGWDTKCSDVAELGLRHSQKCD
jgi:methionyl-tRNA formyltransferase